MTKYFAILAIFCTPALFAQEQPPVLLRDAAHCLLVRDFLRPATSAFRLGYFLDTKSYPGDKALYVVDYTRNDRSEGHVFTIFVATHENQRTFNIQNNAQFVRSAKTKWGTEFKENEDPLGGIWTHEHIALAIKRIERRRTFTLKVADLREVSAECASYAETKK